MANIDFALRDGSTQSVNLTNISNILYIAYTKPDNTTINVPISFMFASTGDSVVVDDFITSFSTTCMNNENIHVMREGGYRIDDVFIRPEWPDEKSYNTLKFCKELCYNISGKTDECIEVTSGSLPSGLELKKNSNGNFAIEGYATCENLHDDYSCRLDINSQIDYYQAMDSDNSEIKFEDLYKSREVEFRNIQYMDSGGSQFTCGVSIQDEVTKDTATLKCVETYVTNGETRTKFIVDELKEDMIPFQYSDGRIIVSENGTTTHDKCWVGKLTNGCGSTATFDEVRIKYPSVLENKESTICTFTLGLCSESGSGYCDTREFCIKVRRNYDHARDNLLVYSDYDMPNQVVYEGYNGDAQVYYSGDTEKASYIALFFVPVKKSDGTDKNIAIRYAELSLQKSDSTDLTMAIDGSITLNRNVSGNSLITNIELDTENV